MARKILQQNAKECKRKAYERKRIKNNPKTSLKPTLNLPKPTRNQPKTTLNDPKRVRL